METCVTSFVLPTLASASPIVHLIIINLTGKRGGKAEEAYYRFSIVCYRMDIDVSTPKKPINYHFLRKNIYMHVKNWWRFHFSFLLKNGESGDPFFFPSSFSPRSKKRKLKDKQKESCRIVIIRSCCKQILIKSNRQCLYLNEGESTPSFP